MISWSPQSAPWRRRFAITSGLLTIALIHIACDTAPPTDRQELAACPGRAVRMAVAASLREIARELTEDLEGRTPALLVETSFGASSALARQLELGAPIDLLISADEELMQSLADKGVVIPDSMREIATGQLVLVAPEESEFASLGIAAIRSPHLKRLGLPANAVPLGRYGYAWLERNDLLVDLHGKIVTTENARANLSAVDQGHVDLALLYESDLRLRPSLRAVYRPKPGSYPPIRYVAARADRAPACLEIDRVLDAWQQPESRDRLAKAGFGLPPLSSVPSVPSLRMKAQAGSGSGA